MSLKGTVTNLEEVSEGMRDFYKDNGNGSFSLQVEGLVPKTKVNEFRDNNIKLNNEIEEMNKKFSGIDMEQYQEAMGLLEATKQSKHADMIKAGNFDDVLKMKTEEYQKQLEESNTKYTGIEGKYKNLLIESQVTNEINSLGNVRQGALTDIQNRAKGIWNVEEGRLVAKDANGMKILNEGGTEISPKEWAKNLMASAPYLFEASSGGGSSSSGHTGGQKTIDSSNLLGNLADVASGKTKVNLG